MSDELYFTNADIEALWREVKDLRYRVKKLEERADPWRMRRMKDWVAGKMDDMLDERPDYL